MTASAEQIAQVRRMIAEPTEEMYDNTMLAAYIEAYPLLDERGQEPFLWDEATTPPTRTANPAWLPTYDLNAAAADLWDAKAGALAADYDFQNDAGRFDRSQAYRHAEARARYYRSRRAPRNTTLKQWPEETTADNFPWIVNLPERD